MKVLTAFSVILMLVSILSWATGGESCGCCPHCGCHETKTVCRLVPQTTKKPKVEYECKCEDFCVPGRSCYVGTECVTDCNGCTHEEKVYQPTCGKVYTKRTLVKKTTSVETCTYKCVAETVCCHCGCCCGGSGGGYSSQSYAPPPAHVHHHVDPHPVHSQTN